MLHADGLFFWGSWNNGGRNVDPLQVIVVVVAPETPWRLPLGAQCQ